FVIPVVAAVAGLLLYIVAMPLLGRFAPSLLRRMPGLAGAGAPLTGPAAAPDAASTAAAGPVRTVPASEPWRTVAVALEMGPADAAVLDHVREEELTTRTRLMLLHVVESAAGRYLGDEASDQESREDQAALEAIADRFRALGIASEARLGFGSP